MLLRLFVVADAHEQNVARVFGCLCRIVLTLDLVDGGIGRVVEFQLYNESRLADVVARNHDKVGLALARGILAVDYILISCPNVGNGQHAGQGVLIVVGEDAGVSS